MQTQSQEILQLHLQILKDLLNRITFFKILEERKEIVERINYLQIIKEANLLSFKDDELIAAFPVSPIKSDFKVTIKGIGTGYAMCAVDALGIAYTFNAKVIIQSFDSTTGKKITIEVDPFTDGVSATTEFFVSYKDPELVQDIASQQCTVIKFYSTKSSINDPNLRIFKLHQALNHAKKLFSPEGLQKSIENRFNPF